MHINTNFYTHSLNYSNFQNHLNFSGKRRNNDDIFCHEKKQISVDNIRNGLSKSYYLSAKATEFLSPYMQTLSETIIPATPLGSVLSPGVAYLLLLASSIQHAWFKYEFADIDEKCEAIKKECEERLSKEDFELAEKRELFKPNYRRSKETQFNYSDITELVELSDKEFEMAKKLFYIEERDEYDQLSGTTISKCIKLPKTILKKLVKDVNLTSNTIADFCRNYKIMEDAKFYDNKLIKTEYEKILSGEKINAHEAIRLAKAVEGTKDNNWHNVRDYVRYYPTSPISAYFYSCYLNRVKQWGISDNVIAKCKDIYNKYETQIYIYDTGNNNILETINFIDEELNKWLNASNGGAEMPSVISFHFENQYRHLYTDDCTDISSAEHINDNLNKKTIAYTNHHTKDIYFKRRDIDLIKIALRHEMMHLNDSNFFSEKDMSLIPAKYFDELSMAGIDSDGVYYAKKNADEFKAVAAEGDTSKYSEEFKEFLVSIGMPKWAFDLDK